MDDFDDEMTGVPFAPTAEEEAADQSAEVARLREALRQAVRLCEAADDMLNTCDYVPEKYPDTARVETHEQWAENELRKQVAAFRASLAAPAAQDDRSAPEDREAWLAEWHRKQRERGE